MGSWLGHEKSVCENLWKGGTKIFGSRVKSEERIHRNRKIWVAVEVTWGNLGGLAAFAVAMGEARWTQARRWKSKRGKSKGLKQGYGFHQFNGRVIRWPLAIQGIGIINQRTWTSRAKQKRQWKSDGVKEDNVEDDDVCHPDARPSSCQCWSRPEQCSESWMYPWGKAEGTFFITFFLLDMNESQSSSMLCLKMLYALIVKVTNDRV